MPRKRRPLDVELFGDRLLEDSRYVEILEHIRDSDGSGEYMTSIRDAFRNGRQGSAVYRKVQRLELAKLVKVRSDGIQNFVELSPKAAQFLGSEVLGRSR